MKNSLITIFFTFLCADMLQIDATNWDDWVYINLYLGVEVDPGEFPEDNLGWDIACLRYHFRTNSGLSGNGFGGAYVDSVNTWTADLYNSVIKVPENSFFEKDDSVNTFYEIQGDEHIFGLPGIANPSLETWGWIDINNNYIMNYTNHQFIVRSGAGDKFYKLWAVDYYSQNGTSGNITIYFDEISPCSLGHDDCGECGGDNSSCSGCMDDTQCDYGNGFENCACNYDELALIESDCQYPLDNYDCNNICYGDDNDDDGICNIDDLCPNVYDPYQNDYDNDGNADACNDTDDDQDGLLDCWIFWYDDGILLSDDEKNILIDSGDCEDFALGIDKAFAVEDFSLYQNYPNPFNPSTKIEYFISEPSNILVDLFDIKGNNIITLENSFKNTGNHTLSWDGRDRKNKKMPSGVYIYRLMVDNKEIDKKKMLLLY